MNESAIGVDALERLPFFAGLDRDDLEEILRAGHPVSFTAGETLVERGDPGDAMYIVLSGAAEVDVGGRFHSEALLLERPRIALTIIKSMVERLREVQDRVDAWIGVW